MRTCQEFAELYELYVLGALDGEDRSEFEEHLSNGCAVCSAGVKRAAGSMTFLATMPEQIEAPARLRRRVLASIGVRKSNWGWIAALTTAAATLMIAVVWLSIENRRLEYNVAVLRTQAQRTAADLISAQAALQFLNEPETKEIVFGQGQPQPPRGRMLLNNRRGVLLLASNLPPAPSGKIYELWVIPKNGAPQPAGLFQSNPRGDAEYLRGGPLDLAMTGAVAVTLEPASGSTAPTAKPIIVAEVSGS